MLRLIASPPCHIAGLVSLCLTMLIANAAGTHRESSREEAIQQNYEAGKIGTVLKLMKVSKEQDPRYYDYMHVHLNLRYVRAHRDKTGRLNSADRKRLTDALKRLASGQALWAMDRLGALAHIEKAHGEYLLGKAREACIKALAAVPGQATVKAPPMRMRSTKAAPRPILKDQPFKDFSFAAFISKIGAKGDLAGDLVEMPDLDLRVSHGRLWIASGPDCVVTLPGAKPQIVVRGTRCEWTPTPLACYRNGRLIGSYDFDELELSTRLKADAIISLPSPSEMVPRVEAQIRAAWAAERSRLLSRKAGALDEESVELRRMAADELVAFAKVKDNLKDSSRAPQALYFLIQLSQEFGDASTVSKTFKLMRAEYPDHGLTAKALVTILAQRSGNGGGIDVSLLPEVMTQHGKMKRGALTAIAFDSFRTTPRGQMENPMLKVAMAALDEILKRGKTDPVMTRLVGRATYFKAEGRFRPATRRRDGAVRPCENIVTAKQIGRHGKIQGQVSATLSERSLSKGNHKHPLAQLTC